MIYRYVDVWNNWRKIHIKEQIKKMIIDSIENWTDEDIYAVSLYVYDYNDNPCKPTVTLGYNTESQVKSETKNAYDEDEARWNYAFWLQNQEFIFGENETANTVKEWVESKGLPYYEDDNFDLDWNDDKLYEPLEKITQSFVSMLIEIVQEIHADRILSRKYGKELPILIHELEYYDEIVQQNIQANGPELVKKFVEWCDSLWQ